MPTTQERPPRDWREGRRLRAWALYQAGWKQTKIAEALGVSEGAVSQWLKRARTHGVEALRAQPPPGPAPKLTERQRAPVLAALEEGAEVWGFMGAVWTTRRVAAVIRAETGVSYHPAHVSRLLRAWGWSVQKPIQRATQRDAAAIDAWLDERWPALKKRQKPKAARSSG